MHCFEEVLGLACIDNKLFLYTGYNNYYGISYIMGNLHALIAPGQ